MKIQLKMNLKRNNPYTGAAKSLLPLLQVSKRTFSVSSRERLLRSPLIKKYKGENSIAHLTARKEINYKIYLW